MDAATALEVEELCISTVAAGAVIVENVSLTLTRGEVLGLVGESGSGKTTTALATLGHVRRGLRVGGGRVLMSGVDLLAARPRELQSLRSESIRYVPQDPFSALTPTMRGGHQHADALPGTQRSARDLATHTGALLAEVGLPSEAEFLHRYPHQLSGGQRQRLTIAIAFAGAPKVVVLDEPTTGLDVTTQRLVLKTISRLCDEHGVAALYVSHDLAVVESIADRVAVMYRGEVVESGQASAVLQAPKHEYTKALLRAVPEMVDTPPNEDLAPRSTPARLAVALRSAGYGNVQVLHEVGFTLDEGQCVAVVGESGSGKTTLARCLAGLHSDYDGEVLHKGAHVAKRAAARDVSSRLAIQYVYQNPYSSLNPRKSVRQILRQPLALLATKTRRDQVTVRLEQALSDVSLSPELLDRFPDELSGGQRQRVALARALIVTPDVLICDEVTSSLDVSVQAVVLELLRELRVRRRLTMVFITHDLAVASEMSDRIVVLQRGRAVESGATSEVIGQPKHAYTSELLSNVLTLSERSAK